MNYHKFFVCIAIACITSLLAGCYETKKEATIKIGFVNIKKIFQNYLKVKDVEGTIQDEMNKDYLKIQELKQQSKKIQDEIPLYGPKSTLRLKKEQELAEKLFEIKYKEENLNALFTLKMKSGIEQFYQEVTKEIEEYGKENKFFMILKIADVDFLGATNTEALRMQINIRDILYWGEEHDLTQIITARLNEKYKNEAKSSQKEEQIGEKK